MAFVVTAITAEVVTIASVAAAVGELGLTLSVVGAVTGSKDLMKVGGYLGLAGGITSLASGAMSAASGAAAEGAADTVGSDWASGLASDAAQGATTGAVSNAMDGVTKLANTADNVGSDWSAGISEAPGSTPSTSFNDLRSSMDQSSLSGAPSTSAGSPATPDASVSPTGSDATTGQQPYSDARNATDGTVSSYGNGAPSGNSFSDIKDWYDKQPAAVKAAIIRGGASAVGGLFQGWTEEQKLALEQNKFALQQQQYNTAISNANAQPTISFQSKPGGIINSAMGVK